MIPEATAPLVKVNDKGDSQTARCRADLGKKRGGGRKRALRSATIDFLRPRYPEGKPDDISYDMIRAEMGNAPKPSDKTIREAFKDLLKQAK